MHSRTHQCVTRCRIRHCAHAPRPSYLRAQAVKCYAQLRCRTLMWIPTGARAGTKCRLTCARSPIRSHHDVSHASLANKRRIIRRASRCSPLRVRVDPAPPTSHPALQVDAESLSAHAWSVVGCDGLNWLENDRRCVAPRRSRYLRVRALLWPPRDDFLALPLAYSRQDECAR